MYSVLIQNQKTIQIFEEYYPIFMESFLKDSIGVCRWIESGTTIDMALPGLEDLVGDKEDWRAIILRVEDETEMSLFPSSPDNPYDFAVNSEQNNQMGESPVPLIRLTQMLGGVPAPEVRFSTVVENDGHHSVKTLFVPENNEGSPENEAYIRLSEKYEYDGRRPIEIIIVTLQCVKRPSEKAETRTAWTNYLEDKSSDFWRRNHYPGLCRFLRYTYVRQGKNEREADYLDFFLCVILLATSAMDPSSLQAYRLYNIKATINKDAMTELFQNKLDELLGCRYYVENEIRRDFERKATQKNPAPEYKMDVIIDWQIPTSIDVNVNAQEFGVVSDGEKSDEKKWRLLHTNVENNLMMAFRDSERTLDDSSERMRQVSQISDCKIKPVGKYEKEDMETELDGIFDSILTTQNKLSSSRNEAFKRVGIAAENVRECMVGRITTSGIGILGVLIVLGILILSVLELVFINKYQVGSILGVVFLFFLLLISLALTGCVFLVVKKLSLNKEIDKYNDAMEDAVSVLTRDVRLFTNFATNIVSFSRGRSYLDRLKNKTSMQESEYETLNRHLNMLNKTISKMEKWANAYYLPIDVQGIVEENYVLDVDINPKDNVVYSIEYGMEYEVPLNDTGKTIKSPVGFLNKLIIEREELFDNA